jgi:hypothetical protein
MLHYKLKVFTGYAGKFMSHFIIALNYNKLHYKMYLDVKTQKK